MSNLFILTLCSLGYSHPVSCISFVNLACQHGPTVSCISFVNVACPCDPVLYIPFFSCLQDTGWTPVLLAHETQHRLLSCQPLLSFEWFACCQTLPFIARAAFCHAFLVLWLVVICYTLPPLVTLLPLCRQPPTGNHVYITPGGAHIKCGKWSFHLPIDNIFNHKWGVYWPKKSILGWKISALHKHITQISVCVTQTLNLILGMLHCLNPA